MFKANRAQLIVMSVITCLTIQQSFAHEIDTPNGPNANPVGTVSNHDGGSSLNSNSGMSKSSTSTTTTTYSSETSSSDEVGTINLKPAGAKSSAKAKASAKSTVAKKAKSKTAKKVKTASNKSGLNKKVAAANANAKAKKARMASKTTKKTIKTVSTNESSNLAKLNSGSNAANTMGAGLVASDSMNSMNGKMAANSEMNKSSTSTIVNEHNITNTVNTTNTTNSVNSKSANGSAMNGLEPLKNSDDELQAELDSLDVISLDQKSSSSNVSVLKNSQNSSSTKMDDLSLDAKDSNEVVPEIAYLVPKKNELLASIGGSGLRTNMTATDLISEAKTESTKFNSINSVAYGFSQGTYVGATMTYLNDEGTTDRNNGMAQTKATASGFGDAQFMVGHKFMIGSNLAIIVDGAVMLSPENSKRSSTLNGNTDENAMSGRMSLRPEAIAYLYNDSLLGGGSLAYNVRQDGKLTNKNAAGVSSEISVTGGNLLELNGFIEQRAKLALGGVLSYQLQEERTESSGVFKSISGKQDMIIGTGYLKYQAIKELQLIGGLSYGRYLNLGGLSISDSNLLGLSLSGKLVF